MYSPNLTIEQIILLRNHGAIDDAQERELLTGIYPCLAKVFEMREADKLLEPKQVDSLVPIQRYIVVRREANGLYTSADEVSDEVFTRTTLFLAVDAAAEALNRHWER